MLQRLARLLLAAAFLAAGQVSLEHPLEHVDAAPHAQSSSDRAGDEHPEDLAHVGEGCTTCAAQGASIPPAGVLPIGVAEASVPASRTAPAGLAAVAPPYRSQAPPVFS